MMSRTIDLVCQSGGATGRELTDVGRVRGRHHRLGPHEIRAEIEYSPRLAAVRGSIHLSRSREGESSKALGEDRASERANERELDRRALPRS